MSKLSVETEFDKAVDAVAESIANCNYRKCWGMCDEADCPKCDLYLHQQNCMNNFADIDRLRVYNKLQTLISEQPMPDTKQYATGKDKVMLSLYVTITDIIKGICSMVLPLLLVFIISAIPVTCISKVYSQSLRDYDYSRYALPGEVGYAGKYRKQILDTLDRTKQYVTDMNKDGVINCIDYTCTFKVLWDKMYDASNCEIVRNKSATMNHLFIRVRQYGGTPWECIEPQAATRDITKYFMEDFWSPDVYNPLYNIYGETNTWLKDIKDGY